MPVISSRAKPAKTVASSQSTASLSGGASLPPPGASDVLYLVDLSGYVFRAYHAIAPLSSSKGEPTHAVLGTINMLRKVMNDRRPQFLAVAMDSKAPSFRREIDARYKANRPPPPPDLSQQMTRCEQLVRAYNYAVFQRDGVEADDLIAALVREATSRNLRVVIVSSDKDLMQLVHDNDEQVLLWDSMRDRVFGPNEVRAKFGVAPSQLRDLLALTGDTSDNIPGVPGVGPKRASDLLVQFGTLDDVYKNIDSIAAVKLKESLRASESEARLSQVLVTLKDDLKIDWNDDLIRVGEPNLGALRPLLAELEFSRLLDENEAPSKRVVSANIAVLNEAELARIVALAAKTKTFIFDVAISQEDAMRADVIGLAIATAGSDDGYYVPIGHRYLGAPSQLSWETVRAMLSPIFGDHSVRKVAADLKFAEIVLARKGIAINGATFDPSIASYLLDPDLPNDLKGMARRELDVDVRGYADVAEKGRGVNVPFDQISIDDAMRMAAPRVRAVRTIADRYDGRLKTAKIDALFSEIEMPLSHVLAEMELRGVFVDVARLASLGTTVDEALRSLDARAKSAAGRDFSLRSRDQLERILFDELNLPVIKKTPKGGRSTDAEVLEELASQHPLPQLLIEYRELDKLKGTYIDALPKAVNPSTGRIHTTFLQTVAATGRLSSRDPNLQNIPIRSELGRDIRRAFVAPPGGLILSADYSQIELRVLAHLSKDPELLDAFHSGQDVHSRTAMLVFGVGSDGVTAEMRRRAKAINFGVIYGMGEFALGKSLGISRDDAARFIDAYFERYAKVREFLNETIEGARGGEPIRTILGRRRFLPNLRSPNRILRTEAERIAKNTPIQGAAADILKLAMIRIGQQPPAPMVLTVHDELVFEVPADRAKAVGEQVREVMQSVIKLEVPLVVDVGIGANWSDSH